MNGVELPASLPTCQEAAAIINAAL